MARRPHKLGRGPDRIAAASPGARYRPSQSRGGRRRLVTRIGVRHVRVGSTAEILHFLASVSFNPASRPCLRWISRSLSASAHRFRKDQKRALSGHSLPATEAARNAPEPTFEAAKRRVCPGRIAGLHWHPQEGPESEPQPPIVTPAASQARISSRSMYPHRRSRSVRAPPPPLALASSSSRPLNPAASRGSGPSHRAGSTAHDHHTPVAIPHCRATPRPIPHWRRRPSANAVCQRRLRRPKRRSLTTTPRF